MADTQRPMNLIATAVSPHRFVILALGLATLAVPLTGCDKPDTSANEEPPAETLVDRSTHLDSHVAVGLVMSRWRRTAGSRNGGN